MNFEKRKNSAAMIIGVTLLLCMAYAILRYHILGGCQLERLALFYPEQRHLPGSLYPA